MISGTTSLLLVATTTQSSIGVEKPLPQSRPRLPLDVQYYLVKWIIGRRRPEVDSSDSEWQAPQLKDCIQVCRTWFRWCAPLLYHRIIILGTRPPGDIDFLVQLLRDPKSPLRRHVRIVTVTLIEEFNSPWILLVPQKLSQYLPSISQLEYISYPFIHGMSTAHPTWPKMLPGLLAATMFKDLADLVLSSCRFHSSWDLLRIMASLPELKKITCRDISWSYVPKEVLCRKRNQLSNIQMTMCTSLSPMLWLWGISQAPSHSDGAPFPGILQEEMHILVRICRCLEQFIGAGTGDLSLRESLYCPNTCEEPLLV